MNKPTWYPITPAAVVGRRLVCRNCPTPCEAFRSGAIDHGKEAATCPLPEPRWRPWAEVLVRQRLRERGGLGDAVAVVAQPIARAVDYVAGTNLAGCAGCGRRKAKWNAAGKALKRAVKAVLGPGR